MEVLLIQKRTALGVDKPVPPHVIDTVPHDLCYDPVNVTQTGTPLKANVIIVRYGIDVSSFAPPVPPSVNLSRVGTELLAIRPAKIQAFAADSASRLEKHHKIPFASWSAARNMLPTCFDA
jgi:hypothetical protein